MLNCDLDEILKQEEFDSGVVGQLMIDEDFDFEIIVSSSRKSWTPSPVPSKQSMMKSTKSTKVFILPPLLMNSFKIFFFFFFLKTLMSYLILDLPPYTKLEDMDLLAGFDLRKLPKVEEAGEGCIRKIQEYMIHDVSSKEVAILPEDKLQKLAVGVC